MTLYLESANSTFLHKRKCHVTYITVVFYCYSLVVLPYTVQIMYHNTLLHTVEEILVVLVGPLSVFLIFVLGVLLCAACLWALGSFPGVGHKIIICLGLNAMLDPFFIAIVDAPLKVSVNEYMNVHPELCHFLITTDYHSF